MNAPYTSTKQAARDLFNSGALLSGREGQFCGTVAFAEKPLSEKQLRWLRILLDRHGLPELMEGVDV